MLINLEGLDGAGKTTQARLLTDHLTPLGFSVHVIHFPTYDTETGERIAAYLRGEIALPGEQVQELFAENRRESISGLERACAEHDVVILDRYYPSAWAYGVARGFSEEWLMSLDSGIPTPEVVVVLDVPVEIVVKRMSLRTADRYERDAIFLNAVRRAYLDLAGRNGWHVIPDDRNPEEIRDDLLSLLIEMGLVSGRRGNCCAETTGSR